MLQKQLASFAAVLLGVGIALYWPASHSSVGELNRLSLSSTWLRHEHELKQAKAAVARFAGTLKFRTISSRSADLHAEDADEFRRLHKYLRQAWPLPFKKLEVSKVREYLTRTNDRVQELSLLFKWQGSDRQSKPVLCISHMDVVAVGSESKWTYPPFSGAIEDGFVWGRGALDLKFTAAALLEAISYHLEHGLSPERTIYLAFGHDEEVGGGLGAASIAKKLEDEGIEFEHILDEGGTVLADGLKGLTDMPVGIIGTAEKAVQNIEIEVHGKGGHTMVPPHDGSTVTARLARLLNKIETSYPPPRLHSPTIDLFKTIGRASNRPLLRLLLRYCDAWPLSWILAQILARRDPEIGSQLRTTAVTTDIQLLPPGRNVIPSLARAHVSYRLLPSDKPARIQKQLQDLAASEKKGGDISVSELDYVTLSPVSSANSLGFQVVKQAALDTLKGSEGLLISPYLMLGRTDSTNYAHLSSGNIFRFMPFTLNRTAGDLQRIHGIDERVSPEIYLDGVQFFIRYLQLAANTSVRLEQG